MGNSINRGKGAAEEFSGKIKKVVGEAVGNERMQARGSAEISEGRARQEIAKASERAKGKFEEVTGSAKRSVGSAIDNQQMEAEGKGRELKGKARRNLNR